MEVASWTIKVQKRNLEVSIKNHKYTVLWNKTEKEEIFKFSQFHTFFKKVQLLIIWKTLEKPLLFWECKFQNYNFYPELQFKFIQNYSLSMFPHVKSTAFDLNVVESSRAIYNSK